ncbi:MAG: hypothetical protein GYA14_14905 [Ignavibacteria bacterium]|nr:hypothetical protein [Ignavibacteria bacterium]
MSENTKDILKTIVIVLVTALVTYFGSQYLPGAEEKVTKDSTVTTSIKQSVQSSEFEAELKSKLKVELIDSLKGTIKPKLITIYKDKNYNLDSLIAEARKEALSKLKQRERGKPAAFTSEVDTSYVLKDSTGKVRDSIKIVSSFISPIPLHSASRHYLKLSHTSYNYDIYTDKRVETTKIITKKTFWDNVKPGLMAAFGYGIKANKWDFFIGAGANIDIEGLIKTLGEEK